MAFALVVVIYNFKKNRRDDAVRSDRMRDEYGHLSGLWQNNKVQYPITFHEFMQNLDLIRHGALRSAEIISLADVGDKEGKAFRQITVETVSWKCFSKTLPAEALDPTLSVGDEVSIVADTTVADTAQSFLFFPGPIFVQNVRNESQIHR